MKKFVAILFAVVMVCSTALPAAISASAADTSSLAGTTINVYNWGEYISDGSEGSMDVNAEFTKRTGIKVNYNNYDTNENMYAKLKSDGVSFDIVIPSDYMIERLIAEGMLQKIDFQISRIISISTQNIRACILTLRMRIPCPIMWAWSA